MSDVVIGRADYRVDFGRDSVQIGIVIRPRIASGIRINKISAGNERETYCQITAIDSSYTVNGNGHRCQTSNLRLRVGVSCLPENGRIFAGCRHCQTISSDLRSDTERRSINFRVSGNFGRFAAYAKLAVHRRGVAQIFFSVNDIVTQIVFLIRINRECSAVAENISVKSVHRNIKASSRRRIINSITLIRFPIGILSGDFCG